MMAGHTLPLAFPLLVGIGLGGVFFGGLWWTVCRALHSTVPAMWFAAGWWIRSSAVLAGFYEVAHGEWRRLLACLLGFVFARWAVLRIQGAINSSRRAPALPVST